VDAGRSRQTHALLVIGGPPVRQRSGNALKPSPTVWRPATDTRRRARAGQCTPHEDLHCHDRELQRGDRRDDSDPGRHDGRRADENERGGRQTISGAEQGTTGCQFDGGAGENECLAYDEDKKTCRDDIMSASEVMDREQPVATINAIPSRPHSSHALRRTARTWRPCREQRRPQARSVQ